MGYIMFLKEKKHLALCDELLYVMRYIRDEISFRKTPTYAVFSSLSSPLLEESGFYRRLKESGDLYLSALECCDISKNGLVLVKDFSMRIGKTAADNQKSEFDSIIKKMEQHAQLLREDLPKKKKLCFVLPSFFGLLTVIVFI